MAYIYFYYKSRCDDIFSHKLFLYMYTAAIYKHLGQRKCWCARFYNILYRVVKTLRAFQPRRAAPFLHLSLPAEVGLFIFLSDSDTRSGQRPAISLHFLRSEKRLARSDA